MRTPSHLDWIFSSSDLIFSLIWFACSFSIVGGEVAQPPVNAIHTAMPRTIVVTSSMYVIMTSSYEYKDGGAGIFPFRLVF